MGRLSFDIDKKQVVEHEHVTVSWDCENPDQVTLTVEDGARSVHQLPDSGSRVIEATGNADRMTLTLRAVIGGKTQEKSATVKVKRKVLKAEKVHGASRGEDPRSHVYGYAPDKLRTETVPHRHPRHHGIPHMDHRQTVAGMETLFETRRLRVRPWTEADAEALFKYASDPDVGVSAGWPPHQSIDESRAVIRDIFSNGHTWALELKETGEAIGCIGYYDWKESNIGIGEEDAELGYWLAKAYWNRGLGTEALRAMVDWCFNKRGFQILWADFFVDNPASGRIMEKCGFRDTGETNYLSHMYRGDERPVKIMRLDYAL